MFTESLCGKHPSDKSREECFTLVRSGVSLSTRSSSLIHKIWVEKRSISCTLLLSCCETMLNGIEEKENIKTDYELFAFFIPKQHCKVGGGQNSEFSHFSKVTFLFRPGNPSQQKSTWYPMNFMSRNASRGLKLAVLVELCIETIQEMGWCRLHTNEALHMM